MLCKFTGLVTICFVSLLSVAVTYSQEDNGDATVEDPRGQYADIEFLVASQPLPTLKGEEYDGYQYMVSVTVNSLLEYGPALTLLKRCDFDDRFSGAGVRVPKTYRWSPEKKRPSEVFKEVVETVSRDGVPKLPAIEFFESKKLDKLISIVRQPTPEKTSYMFYAVSEEEAKETTRTLMFLLERGVKQPFLDRIDALVAEKQTHIDEREKAQEELTEEITKLAKQIEEVPHISTTERSTLRSELRALEIRRAGIRAKWELLSDFRKQAHRTDGEARSRLDDLWLTTQVEFAENDAMRKTVATFVEQADEHAAQRKTLESLERERSQHETIAFEFSGAVEEYTRIKEAVEPLFTLIQAQIQPLENHSNSDQFE